MADRRDPRVSGYQFSNRNEIVGEIHKRIPLSIGEYMRATKVTVAYPTLKDRIRFILEQSLCEENKAQNPDLRIEPDKLDRWPFGSVADVMRALGNSKDKGQTRLARVLVKRAVKRAINAPDNGKPVTTRAFEKATRETIHDFVKKAQARYENETSEGRTPPETDFHYSEPKEKNLTRVDTGDDPFKDGKVSQNLRRLDMVWRNSIANTGALKRADAIEAFNESGDESRPRGHRLRARWEGYSLSTNIAIFEDIVPFAGATDKVEDTLRHFHNWRFDPFTTFAEHIHPTNPANLFDEARSKSARGEGNNRKTVFDDFTGPGQEYGGGVLGVAQYWLEPFQGFVDRWFEGAKPKKDTQPAANPDAPDTIKKEMGFQVVGQGENVKAQLNSTFNKAQIEALLPHLRRFGARSAPTEEIVALEGDKKSPKSGETIVSLRIMDLLRAIAGVVKERFQIADSSMGDHHHRDDFVFSFMAGGRALVAADVRPNQDKDKELEINDFQSRTLIIDLGMTPEQRGRLIQRLMDISTFRLLSLRGHPQLPPAFDALTDIGVSLSRLSTQDDGPDEDEEEDEEEDEVTPPTTKERARIANEKQKFLSDRLKSLDNLSTALDQMNLFFTYGISGKRDATDSYANQVEKLLRQLREKRIAGWQRLDEFLDRFFIAKAQIDRLAGRYETLRERINGAIALVNAKLNQEQINVLNLEAEKHSQLMRYSVIAASAATAFGAIATIIGFFNLFGDRIFTEAEAAPPVVEEPAVVELLTRAIEELEAINANLDGAESEESTRLMEDGTDLTPEDGEPEPQPD